MCRLHRWFVHPLGRQMWAEWLGCGRLRVGCLSYLPEILFATDCGHITVCMVTLPVTIWAWHYVFQRGDANRLLWNEWQEWVTGTAQKGFKWISWTSASSHSSWRQNQPHSHKRNERGRGFQAAGMAISKISQIVFWLSHNSVTMNRMCSQTWHF